MLFLEDVEPARILDAVPSALVQQLLQAKHFKCPHCKVVQGLPEDIAQQQQQLQQQQQQAQLAGGYLPGHELMQVSTTI